MRSIPATIPATGARTKKGANPVREPLLRLLFPSPQIERLRPLRDDEGGYRFAAFAFHHPDQMAPALWRELLRTWPRRKGNNPDVWSDSYAAQAKRLGAGDADVGAAWTIEPDSARKKAARARARPWQEITEPSVVVEPADATVVALELNDVSSVSDAPLDPERDPGAQVDALLPDWQEANGQQEDAFDRSTAAINRARQRDGAAPLGD